MAVIRREELIRWLAGYEKAWREPGTKRLAELFTYDVVYSPSPWSEPVEGLEALEEFWETERDGPDERFTMTSEPVALDNETAVVRVEVTYHVPEKRWRDLWVLRFASGGRCAGFEEWPFSA
jgi:SnoaL-like domain